MRAEKGGAPWVRWETGLPSVGKDSRTGTWHITWEGHTAQAIPLQQSLEGRKNGEGVQSARSEAGAQLKSESAYPLDTHKELAYPFGQKCVSEQRGDESNRQKGEESPSRP